jgi:hemoglobin/transferrin/lactoferrin receptor protein
VKEEQVLVEDRGWTAFSKFRPERPETLPGKSAVILLILCVGASPGGASELSGEGEGQTPAILAPMVTVATREDRPLTEVAGNVTVVTREDLDRSLTTSLDDVFRYTPGLDAASAGTRFGTESIVIRGIGGNRVAMELDGVPLSQHFAVGNFSNAIRDLVDVGLVERIEVLHGPASALYGSSALGGVVALKTPDPETVISSARSRGFFLSQGLRSADESLHTVGAAGAGSERLGALGMIGVRSGHEREAKAAEDRDRQDYDSLSGLAKLVYETGGGYRLRGLYYGHDSEVKTDTRSVLGAGRFRSTTRLEGDDQYGLDLFATELELAPSRLLDGGVLRAWTGTTDIRQDTVDERATAARPVRVDRRFDYGQDTLGLSFDVRRIVTLGSRDHRLALGAEWTGNRIKESRTGSEVGLDDGAVTNTVLGETFPVRDFPVTDVDEIGLYVHDEVEFGRTRLIAGLRFDRYDLDPDPDPVYAEDNPAVEAVGITEDEWSPRLGLVLHLTTGLDGWLQYAHGFRGPSFEDANIGLDIPMFNIRAIPNPDLKPETSDGLEAGLRWRANWARVNANIFYTRYDDFIETKVRLGIDPESGRLLFQSQNIEEARIYGAELEADLSLDAWIRGVSLRASAYWARGDNRETDEPLNSVGPAQAVLAASWSSRRGLTEATVMGTFTRRHSRLDKSSGDLFEAPGYALFDVFISQRLGGHLRVRAGIENVLDRTYWRWADTRGLSPEDPVVPLLSQPGRTVSMDLRWIF